VAAWLRTNLHSSRVVSTYSMAKTKDLSDKDWAHGKTKGKGKVKNKKQGAGQKHENPMQLSSTKGGLVRKTSQDDDAPSWKKELMLRDGSWDDGQPSEPSGQEKMAAGGCCIFWVVLSIVMLVIVSQWT
jgi:hypothetical protein